jgi:hypothetical protein
MGKDSVENLKPKPAVMESGPGLGSDSFDSYRIKRDIHKIVLHFVRQHGISDSMHVRIVFQQKGKGIGPDIALSLDLNRKKFSFMLNDKIKFKP